MTHKSVLVWFRNDLRISDNPALGAALASGKPVLGAYIHEADPGLRRPGGASMWWLHKSLNALALSLGDMGIPLRVLQGHASELVAQMVQEDAVGVVYWNRRYDLAGRTIDAQIKSALRGRDVAAHSFNAALLVEPWDLLTAQDKPYAVFTPFWNALRKAVIARPGPVPAARPAPLDPRKSDLGFAAPIWANKLERFWKVGEQGASPHSWKPSPVTIRAAIFPPARQHRGYRRICALARSDRARSGTPPCRMRIVIRAARRR